MKADTPDEVSAYASGVVKNHMEICRKLQREISAVLTKAEARIWYGMPVWFLGDDPIVGYKSTPKHVNLLFWSGQLFGDCGLNAAGKFKAAQIQFTAASQVDSKALRGWLRKSKTKIWKYPRTPEKSAK